MIDGNRRGWARPCFSTTMATLSLRSLRDPVGSLSSTARSSIAPAYHLASAEGRAKLSHSSCSTYGRNTRRSRMSGDGELVLQPVQDIGLERWFEVGVPPANVPRAVAKLTERLAEGSHVRWVAL